MSIFKLNYTGSQINTAIRKVIDRKCVIASTTIETPVTKVIAGGDVNNYVMLPIVVDLLKNNGFEAVTNGIKYIGNETLDFSFNGVCTVGCDVANTVVHFRIAVNDITKVSTTSAIKLASSTDLNSVNAATHISIQQNDVVKIYVKADKACTISAYHPQLSFVEI